MKQQEGTDTHTVLLFVYNPLQAGLCANEIADEILIRAKFLSIMWATLKKKYDNNWLNNNPQAVLGLS